MPSRPKRLLEKVVLDVFTVRLFRCFARNAKRTEQMRGTFRLLRAILRASDTLGAHDRPFCLVAPALCLGSTLTTPKRLFGPE